MSLQQLAEQARSEQQQTMRQQAYDRAQASLDKVLEKWEDKFSGFGRLAEDGFAMPELPAREEFVRMPYNDGVPSFASYRGERVHGWKIEVEGVPFLFSEDTNMGSLWLLHECPHCGCTGASHFYSLADLGGLMAKGPKHHRCLEVQARDVAYAIATAMRETRLSAQEIVQKAYELHGDLIVRISQR